MQALADPLPSPLGAPTSGRSASDATPWVSINGDLEGDGLAWIAVPGHSLATRLQHYRYLRSSVLLKSSDGSLWHAMFHRPPQPAHIQQVNAALCNLPEPRTALRLVSDELGVAVVELPFVNQLREVDWHFRSLAHAVAQAAASGDPIARSLLPSEQRTAIAQLADRIRVHVAEALHRFRSRLDRHVVLLSRSATGTDWDPQVYNFLVRRPWRLQRQQFARALPALVKSAATAAPLEFGAELRQAVDACRPLHQFLAQHMLVRPSAVRALHGVDATVLPDQWLHDPVDLLQVIDTAIESGRLPTERADWVILCGLVRACRRRFGEGPGALPIARAWLRKQWRAPRSSAIDDRETRARDALSGKYCVWLQVALRKYVQSTVLVEQEGFDAPLVEEVAHRIVVAQLNRMDFAVLAAASRSVATSVESASRASDPATSMKALPLLAGEYRTKNVPRVARSLASEDELRSVGVALGNCLAGPALEHYARRVERGEAHVVGLFDLDSGAARSTIEFRLERLEGGGPVSVSVVQHTGMDNQPASPTCQRALWELHFTLRGAPMQRRLSDILDRQERIARRERDLRAVPQVAIEPAALRRAIGSRRLDRLVVQCHAAVAMEHLQRLRGQYVRQR